MSDHTVNCAKCGALLNVGEEGRYRCPACGYEFHYSGHEGTTADPQQPPGPAPGYQQAPGYQVGFTPTTPQPAPFEDTENYSFLGGMFETLKQTVINPVNFFRSLDPNLPVGRALLYLVILGSVGYFFGMLWALLQNLLMVQSMSAFSQFQGGGQLGQMNQFSDPAFLRNFYLVLFLGSPILGPLFAVAGAFVNTAIFHLFLMIYKGNKYDFWATMRMYCYSGGVGIVQVIPFVGGMVAGVWMLVLYVIGLKEMHDTTYGKSVGAILTPLAVIFCCAMGMVFLVTFGMMGAMI